MSRLNDYSKFDKLVDSDDEEAHAKTELDAPEVVAAASSSSSAATGVSIDSRPKHTPPSSIPLHVVPQPTTVGMTKAGSEKGRYIFEHEGRKIYEWEQSLEEVNMYIDAPPGVTSASSIYCTITPTHLTVGLRGAPHPYLDENTFSKVVVKESSWFLDSNIIHIVLSKAHRGETWESCLRGATHAAGEVDPVTKQEIQKEMMLERFQEEHRGFDFRGAEFNGVVPDPRTFMGGVGYNSR